MTIAITGATGQIGREVAFFLQHSNIHNQLLVRNLEAASFLQHQSSKIVAFDFSKPETHESALENVDKIVLICDSSISQEAIRAFLNAVKLKRLIKKIVVVSGIGADRIQAHFLAKLEALVEESKIPYVALRGNWIFQNFGSVFREMVKTQHELTFPDGGASTSFVDARDIAEVAYHFLKMEFGKMPLGYDITGSESLTHTSVAQLFSKHLPFHVSYKELSGQEAKELLGWSDEWLDLFKDIRNGLTAPISNSVENILGKPSRRLEDYIIENRSLWTV